MENSSPGGQFQLSDIPLYVGAIRRKMLGGLPDNKSGRSGSVVRSYLRNSPVHFHSYLCIIVNARLSRISFHYETGLGEEQRAAVEKVVGPSLLSYCVVVISLAEYKQF